ncbi:MAG: glycosyltransferase, partial [Candidatus Krumholzibacteria bacterium]|nr:glycosyltransferase [Candidatus Krumholzibacteria bacterium]
MSDRAYGNKALIAYFSDASYTGGAEKYLCFLASNIDRDLFDPVLIVNRNPALDTLRLWMEKEQIPVYDVSLNLPYSIGGVARLIGFLRRLRPDLLHMNLPGPFGSQYSLVAPLARLAGVRHVVTTEHLAMVSSFTKGKILKSFGTHWVDRVITVSNDNRFHLINKHGIPDGKIRVVHIGIPDPGRQGPVDIRGELGLTQDTFLLALVGILNERKGHRTVFDAMVGLPGRIHLVVVGEGEM